MQCNKGEVISQELDLHTIDELLEYAHFFYEFSPCSNLYDKHKLTTSMLEIELEKL